MVSAEAPAAVQTLNTAARIALGLKRSFMGSILGQSAVWSESNRRDSKAFLVDAMPWMLTFALPSNSSGLIGTGTTRESCSAH
jgi:hypothetical protein